MSVNTSSEVPPIVDRVLNSERSNNGTATAWLATMEFVKECRRKRQPLAMRTQAANVKVRQRARHIAIVAFLGFGKHQSAIGIVLLHGCLPGAAIRLSASR